MEYGLPRIPVPRIGCSNPKFEEGGMTFGRLRHQCNMHCGDSVDAGVLPCP